MERIERALELAREQRLRTVEVARAASQVAMAQQPVALNDSVPEAAETRFPLLNPADAAACALPSSQRLRELRVVLPQEGGPASQAYRMLRTQVLQRTRQHGMRTLGIVSAVAGEGRTTTAVNLALSLAAEPNQNVVLVDLDLRAPGIARQFDAAASPGLEAWYAGTQGIAALWQRFEGVPRFAWLATGAALTGSSELLASAHTRTLLTELRAAEGPPLVLVDLPPALAGDDMLAALPLLDGVVVVVCERRTRRDDLARLFELLGSTPVVGTVYNGGS